MNPLYYAYDATEHAARMVHGARCAEERGDVEDAISDLEIALKAAERAPRAIALAIESFRSDLAKKEASR